MSEMESKENAILRIIYILLFYVIYGFTDVVLLFITVIQTVLNLFGSGPSQSLTLFGLSLSEYIKQIAKYLSYASNEKPYPFSDWPEAVDEQKGRE